MDVACLDRCDSKGDCVMWGCLNTMFNPNTWSLDNHEFRIYADDMAQQWAVVDEVDYQWAIRWRWNLLRSHGGGRKPKLYLRRTTVNDITVLLHVEIMKRTGIEPPSEAHCWVDHIDGNSLNCRRNNLQWATPRMNHSKKSGPRRRRSM